MTSTGRQRWDEHGPEAERLYRGGVPLDKIARRLGVPHLARVSELLRRRGVPTLPRGCAHLTVEERAQRIAEATAERNGAGR